MEDLPIDVIAEDNRLQQATESASEALARHRWHWTLDESNPRRVSIGAYARLVGRAESVIRGHVNGYANYNAAPLPRERTLGDQVKRAKVGAEKEAVIEAVAKARGLTFGTVSNLRGAEVRRVRDLARERAEDRGTTVEEEAPKIAAMIVRQEAADFRVEDERRANADLRFIEVEGYFAAALRDLARAERVVSGLGWSGEEQELLKSSIDQIRRLLQRIDARLAGVKDFDWDAELEAILEAAK